MTDRQFLTSRDTLGDAMTDPNICSTCKRPHMKRCEMGEMYYSDGSSRVCPNWNKRLDEISGMTPKEADEAEIYRRQFR